MTPPVMLAFAMSLKHREVAACPGGRVDALKFSHDAVQGFSGSAGSDTTCPHPAVDSFASLDRGCPVLAIPKCNVSSSGAPFRWLPESGTSQSVGIDCNQA